MNTTGSSSSVTVRRRGARTGGTPAVPTSRSMPRAERRRRESPTSSAVGTSCSYCPARCRVRGHGAARRARSRARRRPARVGLRVYEGLATEEIHTSIPGWSVWTHDVVGGESVEQVGARADRVIERASGADGDVALVAHAHFLRVLAVRWIGLPPRSGSPPHARHRCDVGAGMGTRHKGDRPLEHSPASDLRAGRTRNSDHI